MQEYNEAIMALVMANISSDLKPHNLPYPPLFLATNVVALIISLAAYISIICNCITFTPDIY